MEALREALQKERLRPLRRSSPDVRDEGASPERDRSLVCARCRHRVTSETLRIEVDEKHLHTCVNPHGILYRIACFRAAPGCLEVGPPSAYWSWFPGFTWQVAVCGSCVAHLGWRFEAAEESFYGLIEDRIVEEPDG